MTAAAVCAAALLGGSLTAFAKPGRGNRRPATCPAPSKTPRRHCVLVSTAHGHRDRLVASWRRAGYEVGVGRGDDVSLFLDSKGLAKVFQRRFVYRRTVSSSLPSRTLCTAYLSHRRVPKRYRGRILSLGVGHQICE